MDENLRNNRDEDRNKKEKLGSNESKTENTSTSKSLPSKENTSSRDDEDLDRGDERNDRLTTGAPDNYERDSE